MKRTLILCAWIALIACSCTTVERKPGTEANDRHNAAWFDTWGNRR
jgi:hypothetical protein